MSGTREQLSVLDLEMPVHFHAGQLFNLAAAAVKRCREQIEAGGEMADDAISALILSCAAAEAAVNEFSANVLLDAPHPWCHVEPATLAAATAVQEAEARGHGTYEKFKSACRALNPAWTGAGRKPMQDLDLMFRARHCVMHLKTEGRDKASDIAAAVRRASGIGPAQGSLAKMPWFDHLLAPEVAVWAVHTSAAAGVELMNLVAEDSGDLPSSLRFPAEMFRRHAGLGP